MVLPLLLFGLLLPTLLAPSVDSCLMLLLSPEMEAFVESRRTCRPLLLSLLLKRASPAPAPRATSWAMPFPVLRKRTSIRSSQTTSSAFCFRIISCCMILWRACTLLTSDMNMVSSPFDTVRTAAPIRCCRRRSSKRIGAARIVSSLSKRARTASASSFFSQSSLRDMAEDAAARAASLSLPRFPSMGFPLALTAIPALLKVTELRWLPVPRVSWMSLTCLRRDCTCETASWNCLATRPTCTTDPLRSAQWINARCSMASSTTSRWATRER
mmetsp:Transcript_107516/g.219407  ORF Transcript_107516/g.219407 Transcript_107516/m.219407 type:complete len:271 (+) Transcript_107516:1191-2003(+)